MQTQTKFATPKFTSQFIKFNRGIIECQELNDCDVVDNLENVSFKNGTFTNVNFLSSSKNVQFDNCTFFNCMFYSQWQNLTFVNSKIDEIFFKNAKIQNINIFNGMLKLISFENCNIEYLKIDLFEKKNEFLINAETIIAIHKTILKNAEIKNGKLRFLIQSTEFFNFLLENLSVLGSLQHCTVKNSVLKNLNTFKMKLNNNLFTNMTVSCCFFSETCFNKSKFNFVDFVCTKLINSLFISSELNKVDFTSCNLQTSDFTTSTVQFCRFTDCDLDNSTIVLATWRDVQFENVGFEKVNTTDTIMQNISRNNNSKKIGRIFFAEQTGSKVVYDFKLNFVFKNNKIHCSKTRQKLTNKNNDFFCEFSVPQHYESDVQFVYITIQKTNFFEKVFENAFPFSQKPVHIQDIVSYVQIGRRIFYYKNEPFRNTELFGFSPTTNNKLLTQRQRAFSL